MADTQQSGIHGVKIDPDIKPTNGWIKPEPIDMVMPSALLGDEDIYEDAGDLDFSAASQGLLLTRIPKMIWENWSQFDDDQEIVLGKLRVEGSLNEIERMSLLLDPMVAERSVLPREYVLEVTNSKAVNTLVFSEKDLPGYSTGQRTGMKVEDGISPLSQRSTTQDRSKHAPQGIEKARKTQGRRGVPKQTAVTGRIQKELKCIPVNNQFFRKKMASRAALEKDKKTTGFDRGVVSSGIGAIGQGVGSSFETFIKTNKAGKKSQKLKAARMPENELRDAIFECFKTYEFWSLASLNHRIKQPEIYLKQNLEVVAQLVKGGTMNGKWQLKAENKMEGYENTKAEEAPEVSSPRISDVELEDFDENIEMEDVPIQERWCRTTVHFVIKTSWDTLTLIGNIPPLASAFTQYTDNRQRIPPNFERTAKIHFPMSEEEDLLAKISRLSSQINVHRTQLSSEPHGAHAFTAAAPSPQYNGRTTTQRGSASWRPPRVTPYPRARGRVGRVGAAHRNRTLILNASADVTSNVDPNNAAGESPEKDIVDVTTKREPGNWVSKRDRHMQLISTSVYDKEKESREKALNEIMRQRAVQKDRREKSRITRHLQSINKHAGGSGSTGTLHGLSNYEVTIDGLRFRVMNGGSKLLRIYDTSTSASSTPKQTNIGGVPFYRSQHGNLYRSGLVKATQNSGAMMKIDRLCKHFTNTGRCLKGPECPFTHDPNAVAICSDYLQKGACAAGDSCDLSHDPVPERVPACMHYLRGKCSNSQCRYAHVRVNPSAPVCRDFATLGYCRKGVGCSERHVRECPDYADSGACGKRKCRLPHVDRAGQIRKRTADATTTAGLKTSDGDSDLSSDEGDYDEIDSDDVNSDGFDEDMANATSDAEAHALSQQQDFVKF